MRKKEINLFTNYMTGTVLKTLTYLIFYPHNSLARQVQMGDFVCSFFNRWSDENQGH